MNGIQFLSGVIRGVWAIDEEAAQSYLPLLANVFNYRAEFDAQKDKDSFYALSTPSATASEAKYSRWDSFDKAEPNSIAVISVKGALMKYDQSCGPKGMQSIGKLIQEADAHHNIGSKVIVFDTPGGGIDGLERLASIIGSTQKPTLGFVNGMACSAGVRLLSECDETYASDDMDRIGSIGVMMSFADVQPALEKLGVKFHTIVAEQSSDKNRLFEEVKKGNYEEYRKTNLTPLAERFINTVKQNFPNVTEEHLSGSVFFAKDVKGILVDDVKTFEDVLERAQELANKQSTNTNQSHTSMKQSEHVNAILGVESLESADGTVTLNAEQLEALDSALGNQAQMQSDLETAQQAQATAEGERDTLKTEVATLKGSAGAQRTTTVVKNDDTKETGKDDTMDAYASAKSLYEAVSGIED